ncbi:hypothetical protein D6792_01685 [Candidatus Parcubacteria bacterium]|nr:MAG: hypothetical protein D6792_01685 [Candidatus Parcubacteria bacterium]
MVIPSLLIAGATASAVSLIGVALAARWLRPILHKWLHFLPSAAAGVFAVIVVSLLEEASYTLSYAQLGAAAIGGFALAGVVGTFAPENVECHGEACETRVPARARRILAADSIHNTIDGVALVGAFASGTPLGWSVAIGVVFHELVQELSEFFVYLESGVPLRRALAYNFLTALTIFLGIALGVTLASASEAFVAPLAGVAAGTFAFVVVRDLLPHTFHRSNARDLLLHMAVAAIGMGIMVLLTASIHLHE